LLYRTSPRCDIAYLIEALSDAYSVAGDRYAARQGWTYACEYESVCKFANPLTITQLKRDGRFDIWGAFKSHFRQRVYRIDDTVWDLLRKTLVRENAEFADFAYDWAPTAVGRQMITKYS
jgi:hypothetical protein